MIIYIIAFYTIIISNVHTIFFVVVYLLFVIQTDFFMLGLG